MDIGNKQHWFENMINSHLSLLFNTICGHDYARVKLKNIYLFIQIDENKTEVNNKYICKINYKNNVSSDDIFPMTFSTIPHSKR